MASVINFRRLFFSGHKEAGNAIPALIYEGKKALGTLIFVCLFCL
jgi:hypothetical protein